MNQNFISQIKPDNNYKKQAKLIASKIFDVDFAVGQATEKDFNKLLYMIEGAISDAAYWSRVAAMKEGINQGKRESAKLCDELEGYSGGYIAEKLRASINDKT